MVNLNLLTMNYWKTVCCKKMIKNNHKTETRWICLYQSCGFAATKNFLLYLIVFWYPIMACCTAARSSFIRGLYNLIGDMIAITIPITKMAFDNALIGWKFWLFVFVWWLSQPIMNWMLVYHSFRQGSLFSWMPWHNVKDTARAPSWVLVCTSCHGMKIGF